MQSSSQITALVEFLNVHSPSALEELQKRFGAGDILKPGLVMGDSAGSESEVIFLETAIKGLSIAIDRVQPNIDALRARLSRAKLLRLWGSLATAVTGAGLFTALLVGREGILTISAAVVNLAGTACALFANHLETPAHSNEGSLAELFKSLVEFSVEAENLKGKLQIDLSSDGRDKGQVQTRIQRANVLVTELRKIELVLGTHQRSCV